MNPQAQQGSPELKQTINRGVALPYYGGAGLTLGKWLLDTSKLKLDIVKRLQGKEFNPLLEKWEDSGEPIVNKLCMGKVKTILCTVLDKNTFDSELSLREIYMLMQEMSPEINGMLSYYKEYGIKKRDFDTFRTTILRPAFIALKRPFKGGERKFLGGQEQTIVKKDIGETQQRKHFFFQRRR